MPGDSFNIETIIAQPPHPPLPSGWLAAHLRRQRQLGAKKRGEAVGVRQATEGGRKAPWRTRCRAEKVPKRRTCFGNVGGGDWEIQAEKWPKLLNFSPPTTGRTSGERLGR